MLHVTIFKSGHWFQNKFNWNELIDLYPLQYTLQWRHKERNDVSNHRCLECLLNRLFRCRLKKRAKVRVTGICGGNLPETGGFPSQRASYAENVSIWSRHHDLPAPSNKANKQDQNSDQNRNENNYYDGCAWNIKDFHVSISIDWSLNFIKNTLSLPVFCGFFFKTALKWAPRNTTEDKSALLQVIYWCRRETSYFLANVEPDLCHHVASQTCSWLIITRVWKR